jgi:hypothetical protein
MGATGRIPMTFPLMYRAQGTPVFFLNAGWSRSKTLGPPSTTVNLPRPNPPPGIAQHLYAASAATQNVAHGPYGLKAGREVWPAKGGDWIGGFTMNHVLLGPVYSFRDARMCSVGGEPNVSDWLNDNWLGFGMGMHITPFGQNLMPSLIPGVGAYNGSSVTGIGTNFTRFLQQGSAVSVGNQVRVVQSVSSDTSLTVTTPFAGSATNATMALVSRFASNAPSPMCINILTSWRATARPG